MATHLQSLTRLALLVLISLSLSGCGTVKDWFSDDDEDATEPAELERIEETARMRRLWSTNIGNGQGDGLLRLQPAISGQRIYVAASNGEVAALNRENGRRIWREKVDATVSGGVGVYDNSLFLGTGDGVVLRLDADDGSRRWSRRVGAEVLAPPQSDGETVVVQTYDGRLLGLAHDSGDMRWSYEGNVPVLTLRGTSTPIIHENLAIAGFANGRVVAFDIDSGAVAWEVRVAISQGRSEIERIVDIDGSMALTGNDLYAASYQGRLVAIDLNAGRKVWQYDTSTFAGVSYGFGNVYVAHADGTVYAYLRSGQGVRWEQGALAYRRVSRPVPVSSYLAVADFEGYVHLLSQVDGAFAARERVDNKGVRADMLSEGNVLYVYGNSGKLAAYGILARE